MKTKSKYLKRIEREVCLINYRSFPLVAYDKNKDEQVFYHPETDESDWYFLPGTRERTLSIRLVDQLCIIFENLRFETLVFLKDNNLPWVTKLSASRTDRVAVINAVLYMNYNSLGGRFNGGVEVHKPEMKRFLKQIFIFTATDAGFHGVHFMDLNETILGSIHYNGEIRFSTFSRISSELLKSAIEKSSLLKK